MTDLPTRADALSLIRGFSSALRNDDNLALEQMADNLAKRGSHPLQQELRFEKEAAGDVQSRLKIHKTSNDLRQYYLQVLRRLTKDEMPERGKFRDLFLWDFWQKEPLLAGAVYSMSAKMTSLSWNITGPAKDARFFAELLAGALTMGGADWGKFISATSQDYFAADDGVFWEVARKGNPKIGRMIELGHIDSHTCTLTGNSKYPMVYHSEVTEQKIRFRAGEFIHFSSLNSPRERDIGSGFCAVARSYRAAKLLMALHDYDDEKLKNLPPEGVAAVSGLTMEEFQDALALWRTARQSNESLTFPQVLWLIGSQPSAQVSLDFHQFSTLPEQFDRGTVIEQYVNTLALDFGVDAREFWPMSSSALGTAAESEIQHMKAKGKGPGEFISTVERMINGELSRGVHFGFDTQDIGEDLMAAQIAKAWVDALFPLYEGSKQQTKTQSQTGTKGVQPGPQEDLPKPQIKELQQEGKEDRLISKEEFLRMLADRGVIPNWMVGDDRAVVFDSGLQEKEEVSNDVVIKWENGALSINRLPVYTVKGREVDEDSLPVAQQVDYIEEHFKAARNAAIDEKRRIRGKPIPSQEALRGDSVTEAAILQEISIWRNHPLLRDYVPTEDEENLVQEVVQSLNGAKDD